VELEPGVDGLLHISQMSERPINRPEDIVNVGDELTLVVIRVEPNERRIGLSLKELAAAVGVEREAVREQRGKPRRRHRGGDEDYQEDEEE
jgi:ribosomal protein S1